MCNFCEEYLYAKQTAKERKKEFGISTVLKVKLVEIRRKNRVLKSVTIGKGHKLLYCPSCGAELRNVWAQ